MPRAKHRSQAHRLVVAVLSGLFGRAVILLAPLVVMAPLLDLLGPSLFGVWLMAVSLYAMLSFLEFGILSSALTLMSKANGRDDPLALRRILGQAYALLGAISLILIALVASGAGLALALTTIKADQIIVVAIVLSSLFLSFPGLLLIRFLEARQAFVQSQLALVAGKLVALVTCLIAIQMGTGPITSIALYSLSSPVILLLLALIYFLARPQLMPTFPALDRKNTRTLTDLGGAFSVAIVLSVIGMNADNVVFALRFGAESVVDYGVPAKLGAILVLVVGTIVAPLWSLYGDALARRNWRWLQTTTLRMSMAGAGAVLCLGLAMTIFADPIMKAWMGRSFADQQWVLIGWTLTAAVIAATAPCIMLLNAAGLVRPQILPLVAFVTISIGAKFLLPSAQTLWLGPMITAFTYAVFVTTPMIVLAKRQFPATSGKGNLPSQSESFNPELSRQMNTGNDCDGSESSSSKAQAH